MKNNIVHMTDLEKNKLYQRDRKSLDDFLTERILNFIAAVVFGILFSGWFMYSDTNWIDNASTLISQNSTAILLSEDNWQSALAVITAPVLLSIFIPPMHVFPTIFWDGFGFTLFSALSAALLLLICSGETITSELLLKMFAILGGGFFVYVLALPFAFFETVMQENVKRKQAARKASGLVLALSLSFAAGMWFSEFQRSALDAHNGFVQSN